MENRPGVYQFLNLVNGNRYIGSSRNIKYRITIHLAKLRGGYHPNPYLQAAWLKYGEGSFLIEAVEYADDNLACEQTWIDQCSPEYNLSALATGIAHTEETKRKISEGRSRWLKSGGAEHLSAKISELYNDPGYKERRKAGLESEETRSKISAGVRAKVSDKEWLAKRNAAIKESWRKRKLAYT